MITVYKFNLAVQGKTTITTDKHHVILSVASQRNNPVIWIEENTDGPRIDITFWTYMTGESQSVLGEYIGTFQLDDGDYIGHVYKV